MGKAKALKEQRRAAREAANNQTFWHGGAAGIPVGDLLRPPTHTKDQSSVSVWSPQDSRADRVYFTIDRELARAFAAILTPTFGHSALYRVQPIGELDVDPDFPTVGFRAKHALVLELAESDVSLSNSDRLRRLQPYATWADGRPMHDAQGRLQLCREYEAVGLTQRDLDAMIEPWTEQEVAERTIQRWYIERQRARGGVPG
jgi:hypothetical protein